jgi:N-acetyl-anhydromuramyl-L-alanine amidase AmpD
MIHRALSQVRGLWALAGLFLVGCVSAPKNAAPLPRRGDEIVVAGQYFHIGTPVVLWTDPGGYDAYRVERRFSPLDKADWESSKEERKDLTTPNRYGTRRSGLSPEELERVRGGGWDLPLLRRTVDQFVLHFDVCGISKQCFNILHDHRGLSIHFMLDVDGTIYQTLDLKERAWHATTSNDRSIGVEIANMGAYRPGAKNPFNEWYATNAAGETVMTIPAKFGPNPVRTPNFVGRPARPEPVRGVVQGGELIQYDYTPEQYAALTKLTAALCQIFPGIRCDYPKDADGRLIPHKLPDDDLKRYQGVIGHYHIQKNKTDPGPALQWERVIRDARRIMEESR